MTSADVTPAQGPDEANGADRPGDEVNVDAVSTTAPARALAWWAGPDPTSVSARTSMTAAGRASLDTSTTLVPAVVSLLPERRGARRARPGALVPVVLVAVLLLAYGGAMALWPLNAVAPTLSASRVSTAPAPPASLTWPAKGAAGVAVAGFGAPAASTTAQSPIASITKIVTALLVLDRSPVTDDDQGPEFRFTSADRSDYWSYLQRNESALDVPVGATLTQYQMLEGMLVGSASNYAARLAGNWWPSDASFASAANRWLSAHGVEGMTIADPTGFDERNTASPAALLDLARLAMQNPTIAGIVSRSSVDLPGAGTVENTNTLLADAGMVGMKTGILDGFNVLAVKNVTVAGTSVQIDAVTLNQPDSKTRWSTARDLFAQVERQLQPTTAVAAGTTVGTAATEWGETVPLVAASDAKLILWNGAAGSATASLRLGEDWTKGGKAGTLTATGPVNTSTVDAVLSRDVAGPDLLWRLTHPLDLLGWN